MRIMRCDAQLLSPHTHAAPALLPAADLAVGLLAHTAFEKMVPGRWWPGFWTALGLDVERARGAHPCLGGSLRAPVSDTLRLALMDTPSACPRRRPGSQTILSGGASRDPCMRPEYGPEAVLPDTCPGTQPQKSPDLLPSAPQAGCRVQPKNGIRNMRLNRHQRRRRLLFGASSAPRGTRTSFIFGW